MIEHRAAAPRHGDGRKSSQVSSASPTSGENSWNPCQRHAGLRSGSFDHLDATPAPTGQLR